MSRWCSRAMRATSRAPPSTPGCRAATSASSCTSTASSSAPPRTPRPTDVARFGAYEILYELKTGGMGAVLLGRRRGPGTLEQLVAIKTIRPEYAQTAAVRAMFLDEEAFHARLGHPAVATVHDFGEQGGTLYMVMEYVAGVSLRGMIGQMPP